MLLGIIADDFTPITLQSALNAYLGRNMWNHARGDAPYPDQALQIINAAEKEWWSDDLLFALRSANPRNLTLYDFAEGIGIAPRTEVGANLQKLVTDAGFLDLPTLIEGLTQAEARVCKVEVPGLAGTGFLVGADLVLTNHHVVAPLIEHKVDNTEVRFRFDYSELLDGTDVNKGTVFHLDGGDPVLFAVPFSPLDSDVTKVNEPRGPDELDFALLRVAGDPGANAIADHPDGPERGWYGLLDSDPGPAVGDRLLIVQHPAGQAIAVDIGQVEGYNEGKTRIRYTANTQGGSSGSPCFDGDMNVVAIHHAGDPQNAALAAYNAGIPLQPIRQRLHHEGFTDALVAM